MAESGNNKGTHDENMGQTLISSTVDPELGTSYDKLFTKERSRKSVNFCTLITPAGNGADVTIPLESIRAISERFVNMAYGFFLGKWVAYLVIANYVRNTWGKYGLVKSILNSSTSEDCLSDIDTKLGTPLMLDSFTFDICMQSWDRSSYTRAMIKLRADVELKYTIVVAMHKLVMKGFCTFIIRVEYEWKPPRCACCKVFGHVQDECPKNIGSNVAKNLKKPSQAPRGVPVGPKMGFKPVKQVYRPVSKKNNANTSGNNKEANSSGYSFWNVRSSSTTTTTHIVEKINKLKRLIIDGKLTLVDDEGNPLEKFDYSSDHNSEDEVEQRIMK
ncbi:hypothetical protein Tco_0012403 [Tanacetum coccineum]